MKRAVDVLGAGVGLALTSPLIGIAALAIKLDDGGPVFYRQRRVGLHGEEFDLFKLRTMVPGAEAEGAGWAVDYADPRITRVGRGPTRLISPCRTFQSWGSSSTERRRRRRPALVIRGSP